MYNEIMLKRLQGEKANVKLIISKVLFIFNFFYKEDHKLSKTIKLGSKN